MHELREKISAALHHLIASRGVLSRAQQVIGEKELHLRHRHELRDNKTRHRNIADSESSITKLSGALVQNILTGSFLRFRRCADRIQNSEFLRRLLHLATGF